MAQVCDFDALISEAFPSTPENRGASARGSTFWKSLRLCPREHALRYEVGLVPLSEKPRPALDRGKVVHAALEHYYTMLGEGRSANAVEDTLARLERLSEEVFKLADNDPEFGASWRDALNEADRTIRGYFAQYASEPIRVLDVEVSVFRPILRGASYSARLDLVAELDGAVWIVEHKTTRVASGSSLQNFWLDLQILGQAWLTEGRKRWRFGTASEWVRGVLVNILVATKEPKFVRVPCVFSPDHLTAFHREMISLVEYREFCLRSQWPRNFGNCSGFSRFNTTCDYFDLCALSPLLSVEDMRKETPLGFKVTK